MEVSANASPELVGGQVNVKACCLYFLQSGETIRNFGSRCGCCMMVGSATQLASTCCICRLGRGILPARLASGAGRVGAANGSCSWPFRETSHSRYFRSSSKLSAWSSLIGEAGSGRGTSPHRVSLNRIPFQVRDSAYRGIAWTWT